MWLGMAAATLGQVAPALGAPLVALAGLPLGYLVWLARTAAALPGAQAAVPAAVVTLLAGLIAVAVAARPGGEDRPGRSGRRRRVVAVVTAVLGAVCVLGPAAARPPAVAPPDPDALRVTALDVGQGDATLVQADGHAVLVDAGPPGAPLLAGLARAGVRRLDALVVTHPQTDHDGGAPAVLARLPVDLLLDGRGGDRAPMSLALDVPLRGRGTRVVTARAGQVLRAGRLRLRVLWPPAGPPIPGSDPNDHAVVAVAEAFGARALLTADAETPVLDRLDPGPVDVLKVSHHGSADPGLPALLARLHPRVALVEVGAHNTYGHPTAATMAALAAAVPAVRRTDRDGTVQVDLRGGRATVTTTRGRRARV
jgi:competence protein ComEC